MHPKRFRQDQRTTISNLAILVIGLLFFSFSVEAQEGSWRFQKGFDEREADDVLRLNRAFLKNKKDSSLGELPPNHQLLYRTDSIGLDNAADMWVRNDSTIVIILRGTTRSSKSLMANVFCAMLPANGRVVLSETDTLHYRLATDERAAVHAGYLLGFAFLSKEIQPKLDSLYRSGYQNYIVAGHSQGGALSYLMSAWMHQKRLQGIYPSMRIKTYASASPKPGNMFFSYDYDHTTRLGWSFSVINPEDVIPEIPFTTQQLTEDPSRSNPFVGANFRRMGFFQGIFIKRAIKKMSKGAEKSSKAYQKYLGGYMSKAIAKQLPGLQLPDVVNSTYFVRPGVQIVLPPNDAFRNKYRAELEKSSYFHHGVEPYRFLLKQYF